MADLTLMIQACFGLGMFIAIGWALGESRRMPDWRVLLGGLGLQLVLALLMFKVPFVRETLTLLNRGVVAVASATDAGTQFVFGYLGGDSSNIAYPYAITDAGSTYILAFRVLPLILFFTVLSAVLWYYRILPWVIRGFSAILRRSMGVGGAVGVSAAGNIFLGMVEAPLLIRPYLNKLTRSELFIVMTCGMATVAGSVMIFYSIILQGVIADALGHILTASVISAPAAIMIARVMIPGDDSTGSDKLIDPVTYHGLLDAVTRGTADGIRLMVNVGAMLIVLISLVALVNSLLSLLPLLDGELLTMERILGWLFAPLAWLMGIPWQESVVAGALLGTKTVLNELIAFFALAALEPGQLSVKSTLIMTYAICGFANFGSLGIMIGGLSAMCPERRQEIMALAPKSLISGTLATCMTGAIAGLILG
ncbi:MAG: nucleoside transporter C-terminal domain-containing protein [SAR86 cluster bacterium]|tara:strand:- start:7630 stop:8901 length:1272 start_codon:yes stop_codon:yes gene_type:complete